MWKKFDICWIDILEMNTTTDTLNGFGYHI